jgi:hypothetical protein
VIGISLAGVKYRNAESPAGTIDRIDEGVLDIDGNLYFGANAWLNSGLRAPRIDQLFCDADGSGVATSRSEARHKAISEAIERWAYFTVSRDKTSKPIYGFDQDPSTSGMAAYPGLIRWMARDFAIDEAVERFSLLHWWEGKLTFQYMGEVTSGVFGIKFPELLGRHALILYSVSSGIASYGSAANRDLRKAIASAHFELRRNRLAINKWNGESHTNPRPKDRFEQRAIFFSSPKGHETFLKRMEGMEVTKSFPDKICDRPIRGPWDKYTSVWRFAFRPPSNRFYTDGAEYFFW